MIFFLLAYRSSLFPTEFAGKVNFMASDLLFISARVTLFAVLTTGAHAGK